MKDSRTKYLTAVQYAGFLAIMAWLCLSAYEPVKLKPHPVLAQALLEGKDQAYILPGAEMEPFRKLLPDRGRFSLILDVPYESDVKGREFHHAVQNYLAPLIINGEPGEPHALVFCSDIATADRRMKETGYTLLWPVAEGKAIAVKTP